MTFKKDWEKLSGQYQLSGSVIRGMVRLAYPRKKLASHKVISGGCANLGTVAV